MLGVDVVGTNLLRLYIQIVDDSAVNRFASVEDGPVHSIVRQVTEVVLVLDLNVSACAIEVVGRCPDVLVSKFVSMWVELPVRTYDSVAVEVIVRRVV